MEKKQRQENKGIKTETKVVSYKEDAKGASGKMCIIWGEPKKERKSMYVNAGRKNVYWGRLGRRLVICTGGSHR